MMNTNPWPLGKNEDPIEYSALQSPSPKPTLFDLIILIDLTIIVPGLKLP